MDKALPFELKVPNAETRAAIEESLDNLAAHKSPKVEVKARGAWMLFLPPK